MFSKYGRIYTIDLSATQANGMNWAHVSIFRSKYPDGVMESNVNLTTSRTGEISKASVSRLRRAQDKLMEGGA